MLALLGGAGEDRGFEERLFEVRDFRPEDDEGGRGGVFSVSESVV